MIKQGTKDIAQKNEELLKNIEQLKRQEKKLKDIAFLNSHSVRKHLSTILGLVNLLEFNDNNDADLNYIMKNIKSISEELDQSIKEISNEIGKE